MTTEVLRLENVSRTFGGVRAVRHVSLQITRGSRTAIIGPNGAGKTTLFGLISGNIQPTDGRVFFKGRDVTKLAPNRRAALGLARTYQVSSLFAGLTVWENVFLGAQALERGKFVPWVHPRRARSLAKTVDEILDALALTELRDTPVRLLSYGDQRKLEIGVSLCNTPDLLLLDEPAAGLSNQEITDFSSLLQLLPASTAIILVEHKMDVVRDLADHVIVLHQGETIESGTPDEVMSSDVVRQLYFGGVRAARNQ